MTSSVKTSIQMDRREFYDASIFAVEAGSTGLREGDGGHGGESVLVLEDCGGTCWEVQADDQTFGYPKRVTVRVWGDSEGRNLLLALEQATTQLRLQLIVNEYRGLLAGTQELSNKERKEVEADLDAIQEEIASEQPKPRRLRERLRRLEDVLISGALGGVEATTKDSVIHLIHSALRALFGG